MRWIQAVDSAQNLANTQKWRCRGESHVSELSSTSLDGSTRCPTAVTSWQLAAERRRCLEIQLQKLETRRLATANRSRASIWVTKFLFRAGGVVKPVKIFLSSSLTTMQNLVALCHTVWAHFGDPKKFFWDAGAPFPWDWDRVSPCWNKLPPGTP